MAVQQIYSSDKNALWLQRSCFDPLEFLGCHDVSDLVRNKGELVSSRIRTGKGKFKVKKTRRNTPEPGTVTFTFFREIVNLMSDLPCAPNILVYYSDCGADENPNNYDFIDYLSGVEVTDTTQAGVVNAIAADGATDVGVDIVVEANSEYQDDYVLKPLRSDEIIISALASRIIADISVCDPDPECSDDCGNATIGCQTLWIITNGSPGVYGDAEIYKSTDGGATWIEQTNAMTIDSDNLSSVSCSGNVVIITNGTTAEYQQSNDGGTVFTLVTTPDEIINEVFVLAETKIWFAANNGNIYFSSDEGASISTQDDGVATAENLNSIHFADSEIGYAVGDNNAFVTTINGGTDWSAGTGPSPAVNLTRVRAAEDTDAVFVGDASGNLFRSLDKGVTWTTIITGLTAFVGGISDIAICECNRIVVSGNDANGLGSVRESIDGGNNFTSVMTPAVGAESITALTCCDVNTYYAVGDAGLIAKLSGESFRDSVP